MSEKPQNEYLKAKIMTASPEQLQMLLYDGAIRFCQQAQQAMQAGDVPAQHDKLIRAQRIVLELQSGLKKELNPELCDRLASLYNYVYRLLIDANFNKSPQALQQALDLLLYQRDTWQMLLDKLRQERSAQASPAVVTAQAGPGAPARPSPGGLLGGMLSLEG